MDENHPLPKISGWVSVILESSLQTWTKFYLSKLRVAGLKKSTRNTAREKKKRDDGMHRKKSIRINSEHAA